MADDEDFSKRKFQIACGGCSRRLGRPIICSDTGRFTTDGTQTTPDGHALPVGILGLRLLCNSCGKQSYFYPTHHHYTCRSCGHNETTYISGGVHDPKKGQGISYTETIDAKGENQAMLDQLRQNAIGGWGSGG